MACVRPDGSLSTSGRLMLSAVAPHSSPEDVAGETGMPLFRVRSALRELAEAGFVNETDGSYSQTEKGAEKANQFHR
jgi:predicted transcriptional regulator